jgi:hypothetical protein
VRRLAALALLGLLLAGCQRTRHDLIEASVDADTRDELKAALGAPDELHRMGPVELWTYEASDGTVSFLITGEKVQIQTSGPEREEGEP